MGLDRLGESFDDIGYAQLINVNTDGVILSGHARWMLLKREGVSEVEVFVPDRLLTPKQEEAVIIRMNKNVAGEWDLEKLNCEWDIEYLKELGFTESELLLDFKIPPIDNNDKDDEQSEQEKQYRIEIKFTNDMDMMDLYDDLISKGYLARILK